MKLPRDLSGQELARLLRIYGYQAGSHLRPASTFRGTQHHLAVPAHQFLKTGTLSAILSDVAVYLKLDQESIRRALFGG